MNHKVSAVFMDLDGTALQKDHESFTPALNQVLEGLYEKGIPVIPCTGRPYGFLPEVLKKKADWMSLVICSNGAVVRNLQNGKILSGSCLKYEEIMTLLKLSDDPDIAAEAMTDSSVYLTAESLKKEQRKSDTLSFHLNRVVKGHAVYFNDLRDLQKESVTDIEKINLFCTREESRQKILKQAEILQVSCAETGPMHFEVTSSDATKAKAMQKVISYFRIPLSETMAVGDSENDRSVLELAGVSVAMANAPAEIQKICDRVTDRYDEDGAARTLAVLL